SVCRAGLASAPGCVTTWRWRHDLDSADLHAVLAAYSQPSPGPCYRRPLPRLLPLRRCDYRGDLHQYRSGLCAVPERGLTMTINVYMLGGTGFPEGGDGITETFLAH